MPAAETTISYPPDLPITARRDELLATIRDHQVVVVAGATGSGKSTQLPKLCLELGRGVDRLVGHTQPRRIAARAVAERVAEELGSSVGERVGYTVRFTDEVGPDTQLKVMTDGILLAEIQRDRTLSRYDTLIIDEAHERSLNIDFILGYLKQLLPRRPDLKVIVTSATIDTARFSAHFDDAPVVEVEGRTYPVEIRYRPVDDDGDPVTAVCDAVEELFREEGGDILVFQSGQREIRDVADAVRDLGLPNTEVLPLYARLTAAEQHRVFSKHRGRRVVVSTNVAETSLTVPGIRAVIDAGTARISRYNRRTKVQRLPIERISQASADQRAGRCGRVGPGVCIRLYDEEDFESRPEFTEPEVLRTNLASVILQMAALGLGRVEDFPFVEPPDSRSIRDGLGVLEELGAIETGVSKKRRRRGRSTRRDDGPRLTPLGRRLARLPIDPRLARMILAADDEGCVHEVLVIAAALSIQDPREWPAEKRGSAAEAHARFAEPGSDFITYLNLWTYLRELRHEVSGNQFRRRVKSEYLHYLRVREWQDLYSQLLQVVRRMKIKVRRNEAGEDQIHRALLTGSLSTIGARGDDGRAFSGPRGLRFDLSRDSVLAKSPPRWVMAAEIVETNRPWARVAGRIRPEWIEDAAAHVVTYSHGDPYWDDERGTAMCLERVSLHGLPIVAGRPVPYRRVDEHVARGMFIEHVLLDGEVDLHHAFVRRNRERVEEVRGLEDRLRRRDVLADELARYRFFDERVGPHVTSLPSFEKWWKRAREEDPELLDIPMDVLIDDAAGPVDAVAYPRVWRVDEDEFPVRYRFDPTEPDDGVTVEIPLRQLDAIDPTPFSWNVPGHRQALVDALLRSLPKAVRRQLTPIADTAAAVADAIDVPDSEPTVAVTRALRERFGLLVDPASFDLSKVDGHLLVGFAVVDGDREIARGKDLRALRDGLVSHVRRSLTDVFPGVERPGATDWVFGDIPTTLESRNDEQTAVVFPALADEGETVALRLFGTEGAARLSMWKGTRRLLLLALPSPVKAIDRLLDGDAKLALARAPHGSVRAALDDCIAAALDRVLVDVGGPVRAAEAFDALARETKQRLPAVAADVVRSLAEIVDVNDRVDRRLTDIRAETLQYTARDIERQRGRLLRPGFVQATGTRRLPDIVRYLQAIERRLEKVRDDPDRDAAVMKTVLRLEREQEALAANRPRGTSAGDVAAVRWMIEELRVSLFAQELGTSQKVSETRIRREIERLAQPQLSS